ncbi:Aldo/keto reductase [Sesbania bispinosa]|nr:Aldo/keto reductase [Sesbania bispinosa]KAJ1437375.1 Aldo/keto reductase [Sesbania bispinosa]
MLEEVVMLPHLMGGWYGKDLEDDQTWQEEGINIVNYGLIGQSFPHAAWCES